MYKKFYLTKTVITLSLLVCSAFASTQAASLTYNNGYVDGYSLPDINPAGSPNFENSTSINWQSSRVKFNADGTVKSGVASLSATYNGGDFLFNTLSKSYLVSSASYTLDASFFINKSGQFELRRGSVTIMGDVDAGTNGTASGNLFTANLDSWNFGDDLGGEGNFLIGFDTTINHRKSSICDIFGCTTNESAYLSLLNNSFDPYAQGNYIKDRNSYNYSFISGGLAVTTIPLPASVWLFASGLIGIAGLARRKRA